MGSHDLPKPLLFELLNRIEQPGSGLIDLKVALGHNKKLPHHRLCQDIGKVRLAMSMSDNFRTVKGCDREIYDNFFRDVAECHRLKDILNLIGFHGPRVHPLCVHNRLRNTKSKLYAEGI